MLSHTTTSPSAVTASRCSRLIDFSGTGSTVKVRSQLAYSTQLGANSRGNRAARASGSGVAGIMTHTLGTVRAPPARASAVATYGDGMADSAPSLRVIGLMSGTSFDAVDAGAAELAFDGEVITLRPLGLVSRPYPAEIRDALADALPPDTASAAKLCELDT